jgi:hypothetical protein
MTCPVGGETFSAWQPAMFSTYGERPDGKPYSYLPFPFPLPECPSNKLVVFDKVSTQDAENLARLIGTADYKRLIGSETTYYRAYWLAGKLGQPEVLRLGLLLSAIWQVTPDPRSQISTDAQNSQFQRYQTLFIRGVRALGPATPVADRLWLEARAANAARQMGRFDEAARLIDTADRSLTLVTDKRGWDTYLAKLRAVIARKDAGVEPLDMIPEQEVAFTCLRRPPSTSFDKATCTSPEVVARMATLNAKPK